MPITKVRLTQRVPVGAEHKMDAGNEYDVVEPPEDQTGLWVMGAAGEKIKLLHHEYEAVEQTTQLEDEDFDNTTLAILRFKLVDEE